MSYLSEQLKTDVSINKINYSLGKSFVVKNILIKDEQKDTLVYIEKLKVKFKNLKFKNKQINIQKININNLYSNIYNTSSDSMNFFWLLKNKKDSSKNKLNWKFSCYKINILNSKIKHTAWQKKTNIFDKINIIFANIYVDSTNINITNTGGYAMLNNVSFIENTGFKLNTKNKNYVLQYFYVSTKNSVLNFGTSNIALNSKNKLKTFSLKIKKSIFTPSDFYSIYNDFRKIKSAISFSGNILANNKTIRTNNFKLIFGKKSSLLANAKIKNYNNVDKLSYQINFSKLFLTRNDFFSLSEPFVNIDTSKLIKKTNDIKELEYKGVLQGTPDSIFSKGSWYSNLGTINTNLSVKKQHNSNDSFFIVGNLQTLPVHLNKVLRTKSLGDIKLNINTNGTYSETQGIDLNINGLIKSFELNNYNIDSVSINGILKNDFFEGIVKSYDKNLNFDFKGSINLKDIHAYNFTSNIYNANLHKLGITKNDSINKISAYIKANFTGNSLENSEGKIVIKKLNYVQDTNCFKSDSITMTSKKTDNGKIFNLKSKPIDIQLIGKYNIIAFMNDYKLFANNFLPSYVNKIDTNANRDLNIFDFNIDIKDANTAIKIFLPKLTIAPKTKINGNYNSSNSFLNFTCLSPFINFNKQSLSNLKIKSYTKDKHLFFNLQVNELKYSKKNSLKNFLISIDVKNDTVASNINWNNRKDINYSGNINAKTIFTPTNKTNDIPNIKINFTPSYVVIADTLWNLNNCQITKNSSTIFIDNVRINNDDSKLTINGKLSENKADSVFVNIKNFNFSYLNILLSNSNMKFGGYISGKTKLKDVYGERIIDSDFDIKNLSINNKVIGNTCIESKWDKKLKQLKLQGYSKINNIENFNFKGFVSTQKNEMLLDIDLKQLQMSLLEIFVSPTIKNISGDILGNIKIFKKKKKMWWEGVVFAKDAFLTVETTNVRYSFSDTVLFYKNDILFGDINVYDKYKNTALLNGKIQHDNFKNFKYNFFISTNKILGINTTPKISPMYYGKAFGSGDVSIKGDHERADIYVVATSKENSKYSISIEGRNDIKDNDFITFVQHNKLNTKKNSKVKFTEVKKSKAYINMNLTVTPNAELQIIFDPMIGDALKAKGNANINIDINPETVNMYGDFIIDNGDLSFTLQDVINKRLKIKQGSNVSWQGDPINAMLNIDAVYEVKKASIIDLTGMEEDREKYVPVNCHLLMTNNLYNPKINFSIETTSNSNNEILEQINNLGKDEINKQIISLLLLNKFISINNLTSDNQSAINTSSLGAATISELLSNQLSQWLSQTNSGFDTKVTLRPSTETKQAEYGVALSKELWNDRLSVYGNFEYGGQNIQAKNNNSPYSTDFSIELKLTKKGNLRVRAFQKNNEDIDEINTAPYKQGIGIFYTEEFDTFSDLLQKMFKKQYATKPKKTKIETEQN